MPQTPQDVLLCISSRRLQGYLLAAARVVLYGGATKYRLSALLIVCQTSLHRKHVGLRFFWKHMHALPSRVTLSRKKGQGRVAAASVDTKHTAAKRIKRELRFCTRAALLFNEHGSWVKFVTRLKLHVISRSVARWSSLSVSLYPGTWDFQRPRPGLQNSGWSASAAAK